MGQCRACKHLGLKCEYKRPIWWSNNEQRKQQKEDIKDIIKRTKLCEKTTQNRSKGANTPPEGPPGLTHSLPTSATYSEMTAPHTREDSVDSQNSQYSIGYEYSHAHAPMDEAFDPFYTHVYDPQFDSHNMYQPYTPTPYEVDIKTERQTYVDDIPTRRDTCTSTFSTYQPPPHGTLVPSLPEDEWLQEDIFGNHDIFNGEEGLDFNFFDFSHGPPHSSQQALVQVDDCDRPLLDHFIDNVLRLIFPILEVNQHGSARSEVILPALESNKCYLHCCLSIAAIHLKSTSPTPSEQIDSDIMRHRYATVSELCEALHRDTDHLQILEATLGMMFFQCIVGRPDDCLPDIPWHQHFQAASSLVRKLELPHAIIHNANMHPPFNMTLTSWIDILGATMLGRAPQFANTYREKHLSASTSGLCELMGCEDRMMYLISEIACLDALKSDNTLDSIQLCQHIKLLGEQIDLTDSSPGAPIEYPISSTGAIRPKQLSRNITALFRLAARIYLCSLVPGSSRHDIPMLDLISRLGATLSSIPPGPDGFDRSLVWPLLIGGSLSTPSSSFRTIFADRLARMGESAEFGSFGRMTRVLAECWRMNDEEGQNVHWRDVMQQRGWDYLLI